MEAIRAAKKRGLRVAFNPAPSDDRARAYPLELVDLLCLNETEAAAMTGRPAADEALGAEKLQLDRRAQAFSQEAGALADHVPGRDRRVQLGWRGIKSQTTHFLPFDPPGPMIGDWELGTDTASIFEVSTPNWSALATIVGSLNYIKDIGVDAIRRHSDPMLKRLQEELPKHGFERLTPPEFQGTYVVFSSEGVGAGFRNALKEAKIYVTAYKNKIRISPTVYNDIGDVDRLLKILCA